MKKLSFLDIVPSDTLLNVFLAIAVDNIANAQAVTQDEEEEERLRQASRKRRLLKMEKRRNGWAKARQIPVIMALKNINQNKNDNPFHNMKPVYPSVDHCSPRYRSMKLV